MISRATIICLATMLLLANECSAQSIYHPAGLSPGDQYRLAFVTEGLRDGTSTDIEDYNTFVQSEAARAGSVVSEIASLFFALGSTQEVHGWDNTGTHPLSDEATSVPIYLVDGMSLVAENNFEFYAETLQTNLDMDQFLFRTDRNVLTGDLLGYGDSQARFLSLGPPGADRGLGSVIRSPTSFTSIVPPVLVTASSTRRLPFYAVSTPLTVVPEPHGLVGWALLTGVAICQRRRRNSIRRFVVSRKRC